LVGIPSRSNSALETLAGTAREDFRELAAAALLCFQQGYIASVGHERPDKDVRCERGPNTTARERNKEVAATPLSRNHRQEHNADAERGIPVRGTAICAAPSRWGVALGMPSSKYRSMFFDGNRSVVHKNADGEGQSSEGMMLIGSLREA